MMGEKIEFIKPDERSNKEEFCVFRLEYERVRK